jgi:Undecaprenyl-phosphate glucose phosphotransferase
MIRRRLTYRYFSLRLAMFILPAVAFGVAGYIRFATSLFPAATEVDHLAYAGLTFFATLVWATLAEHYGLFRFGELWTGPGKTKNTLWAWGGTYITVLAATFFYRSASFSRVVILISAIIFIPLVLLTQILFHAALRRELRRGKNAVRLLIIGADDFADRTGRYFSTGQEIPCAIVGFVRLPGQDVTATGAPILDLDDIGTKVLSEHVDDVIVAVPPARFGEISGIVERLEALCVPMRAVLDLGDRMIALERVFEFGKLLMLDLQSTPADSTVYLVIKRGFDIVFSALVLVLTSPILAVIAVAVRLSSPGPIIFKQVRVGLNGQPFKMYKFRSMKVTTQAEADAGRTAPNDSRRTKVGTFLRRTNLDELPQFFNVLKGEMSVVGPRPEVPIYVRKYQDVGEYNARHYLKVGITGWAQVNGWRGETSIAKRVEYDLYYIQNWSLGFDVWIVALTVSQMFTSKNAY